MQFRIQHFLFAIAIAIVAVGCSPPSRQVTTADIRHIFTEHSNSFSELAAMLEEDKTVIDIDQYGEIGESVSLSRQKQYLKVRRDTRLPVRNVFCDRSDGQLTVNVFIDGWENFRLVYSTGDKPKELVLMCNECPTQLFEPISDGWFVGIIEELPKDSER